MNTITHASLSSSSFSTQHAAVLILGAGLLASALTQVNWKDVADKVKVAKENSFTLPIFCSVAAGGMWSYLVKGDRLYNFSCISGAAFLSFCLPRIFGSIKQSMESDRLERQRSGFVTRSAHLRENYEQMDSNSFHIQLISLAADISSAGLKLKNMFPVPNNPINFINRHPNAAKDLHSDGVSFSSALKSALKDHLERTFGKNFLKYRGEEENGYECLCKDDTSRTSACILKDLLTFLKNSKEPIMSAYKNLYGSEKKTLASHVIATANSFNTHSPGDDTCRAMIEELRKRLED